MVPLAANVRVISGGDILITCSQCDVSTTIKMEWAKTAYWELFAGQALLVILGHAEKVHHGSLSETEVLLRAEYGKGNRPLVRLSRYVGIRGKGTRKRRG